MSKVSYTFSIIGFIAKSTLKFINNTRCKFFWNVIFKIKNVCSFVLTLKHSLQFATIENGIERMALVLVCSDR